MKKILMLLIFTVISVLSFAKTKELSRNYSNVLKMELYRLFVK